MDTQLATSNKKKFLIITVLLIVFVLTVLIVSQKRNTPPQPVTQTEQISPIPQEPKKTDFSTSIPTDFPTDIPLEKGIKIEQSYSLNYTDQKQLTVVFPSTKTVKENYTLYTDFLKEQEWNISNKYESEDISSLYGMKEYSEINITISNNISTTTKSIVSISILKK